jgi:hypothetical protein
MLNGVKAQSGAHQRQERTWCVRATAELADWVLASADYEQVRPSVVIREAVGEYLENHHGDLRPVYDDKD